MGDTNTYKIVFEGAKAIEAVLEEKFGADGRGLHTKALSIQGHLGEALVKRIQFLATVRNKLAHESDFQDVPLEAFVRAKDQVLATLEALDPPEVGSQSASSSAGEPRSYRSRAGRVLLVASFMAALLVGFVLLRSGPGARSGGKDGTPEALLWSVAHPMRARQAFPWREEQAAFIASGESGELPNETLWRATSKARQVQRRDGAFLEMDIELGGGKTRGTVAFPTKDSFGRPEISAIRFQVELLTQKVRAGALQGLALQPDGTAFGGFSRDAPFYCQREVSGGCGAWADRGVTYFALSRVSFRNALKIVYGEAH